MRRVLFRWRGVIVYSYTVFLYLGLLLGVVAGNIAAHFRRIDRAHVYWATLVLIAAALAGTRVLYVATHWERFRAQPSLIWKQRRRGASMYGGLVLALICSIPVLAVLHLQSAEFWDISVFTILTGMIFVRIGCFLNGCCAGRSCDSGYAMYLPDSSGAWKRRFPTQLLEAGYAGALLVCAALVWPRLPHPGELFLLLCAAYGAARFAMEFLREREAGSRRMTIAQYCSLLVASTSVLALAIWSQM